MNSDKVHDTVCKIVTNLQTAIAGECPEVGASTVPLKALSEFDSPVSISATGQLAATLGINIPNEVNVFGDKDGCFTIEKTVKILCDFAEKQSGEEAKSA